MDEKKCGGGFKGTNSNGYEECATTRASSLSIITSCGPSETSAWYLPGR